MAGEKPQVLAELPLHEKVKEKKVAMVYTGWHKEIIDKLREGARAAIIKAGIKEENIHEQEVPGSFELPLGSQIMLEYTNVDGVVALGCIIKGETPHFHYLSEAVTMQLGQLNLRYNRPVSFGVLTVDDMAQAQERAGGKWGNKGQEAAEAMLQMLSVKESLRKEKSKGQIGFGSGM